MRTTSIFLDILPNELLLYILPLLTPDALIFLSQTSRKFRQLISPERHHFTQALLALELNPAYGGSLIPVFSSRSSTIICPPYDDNETWDGILYACVGCMKLRHHSHFDSHSILRLRMRKPEAHCNAANTLAEPGDSRARALLARQRIGELEGRNNAKGDKTPKRNQKVLRLSLARQETEEDMLQTEIALAGTKRHLRFCMECRYQRGQYKEQKYIRVSARPQYCIRWRPPLHERVPQPRSMTQITAEALSSTFPRQILTPRFRLRCPSCEHWKYDYQYGVLTNDCKDPNHDGLSKNNHYAFALLQKPYFHAAAAPAELSCNDCTKRLRGADALRSRQHWQKQDIKASERNDLDYAWMTYVDKVKALAKCEFLDRRGALNMTEDSVQLVTTMQRYTENLGIIKDRLQELDVS